MARKIRKQIYLAPHQEALLKKLSAQEGVTEAELIREALDAYLALRPSMRRDMRAWERERRFIDQLIDAGPVSGHRTWTREDLYER